MYKSIKKSTPYTAMYHRKESVFTWLNQRWNWSTITCTKDFSTCETTSIYSLGSIRDREKYRLVSHRLYTLSSHRKYFFLLTPQIRCSGLSIFLLSRLSDANALRDPFLCFTFLSSRNLNYLSARYNEAKYTCPRFWLVVWMSICH